MAANAVFILRWGCRVSEVHRPDPARHFNQITRISHDLEGFCIRFTESTGLPNPQPTRLEAAKPAG